MTTPPMRGATRLRDLIAIFLSSKMPAQVLAMRQQFGLTEETLPFPKKYNSSDPTEAEVFPYVGSYITGADQVTRTGNVNANGSVDFSTVYEVTIFISARTALLGTDESGIDSWEKPTRDSALRIRDDLISALQNILLTSPTLGTAGQDNRAIIDEDTLRIAYPEPVALNTYGNFSCTGLVTLNIEMIETTTLPSLGLLEEVELHLHKMDLQGNIVNGTHSDVTIDLTHSGELHA